MTCGITFTFGGLKIDQEGRVLDTEDAPIPGLYAAGELVGGLFYHNYPGGSGLMAGSVFGKLAGESAAGYAGVTVLFGVFLRSRLRFVAGDFYLIFTNTRLRQVVGSLPSQPEVGAGPPGLLKTNGHLGRDCRMSVEHALANPLISSFPSLSLYPDSETRADWERR